MNMMNKKLFLFVFILSLLILAISSIFALWTTSLDANIKAFWKLNETAGTVGLDSVTRTPLGLYNSTFNLLNLSVTGKIGTAVNFSNTLSNMTIPNTIWNLTTGNMTLSFWLYLDDNTTVNDNIWFYVDDDTNPECIWRISDTSGNMLVTCGDGAADFSFTVAGGNLTTWHHWVLQVTNDSAGNATLWRDGAVVATDATVDFNPVGGNIRTVFGDLVGSTGTSFKGRLDEVGWWDKYLNATDVQDLYNNGAAVSYQSNPITSSVTLNYPTNNTATLNNSLLFNCTASIVSANVSNISLYIDGVRNFTNSTLTQNNISLYRQVNNFPFGSHNWTCALGNTANSVIDFATNFSFTILTATENSQTFNTTTYESSSEGFVLNLSYNSSIFTSAVASLIYNGTRYSGSQVGSGNTVLFTRSVNIPLVASILNNTFYWQINLSDGVTTYQFNSTTNNQTVKPITFGLCNATLTVPYINISFKNETTAAENVNASIVSTWYYYFSDASMNKTLSYSNAGSNRNYAFCFDPSDRSMNAVFSVDYSNSESSQRSFTSTSFLTNTTTNLVLYLLPNSAGLYAQFQTVTTSGSPISNVQGTITRTLGGATVTVASDTTDSSGLVVFFLNPDVTYTATFSKAGFPDNIFTFVPVTDIRTVTMGSSTTIPNGTQIAVNTSYQTYPLNATLVNNTNYVFALNVTSGQTITLISFNITNASGYQLGYQTNAGQGYISQSINTGNYTKLIGTFKITTGSETITFTRVWIVGKFFEGDYSFYKHMKLFVNYGFSDFIRLMIVLFTVFTVVIFMSDKEIDDNPESKIIVAVLVIWLFSYVGWLDTNLVVNSTTQNVNRLAQFSSQFGIAILSTAGGAFFLIKRMIR